MKRYKIHYKLKQKNFNDNYLLFYYDLSKLDIETISIIYDNLCKRFPDKNLIALPCGNNLDSYSKQIIIKKLKEKIEELSQE